MSEVGLWPYRCAEYSDIAHVSSSQLSPIHLVMGSAASRLLAFTGVAFIHSTTRSIEACLDVDGVWKKGDFTLCWKVGEFMHCCVSKSVPHLTCYNIDIHDPIAVIFGRSVSEKVDNQTMLCFPTSPIWWFCFTLRKRKPRRQLTGALCVQHSPTAAALSTSFLLNHAPKAPSWTQWLQNLGSHTAAWVFFESWVQKIEEIRQLVEFSQCTIIQHLSEKMQFSYFPFCQCRSTSYLRWQ